MLVSVFPFLPELRNKFASLSLSSRPPLLVVRKIYTQLNVFGTTKRIDLPAAWVFVGMYRIEIEDSGR
jgi:hypothetical protein